MKDGLKLQREYPLHKKLVEFFWGGWFSMCNWNNERQANTAFMYGMSKTIDRLYPNPEDLEKKKEAYHRHLVFYNTTPQFMPFQLGLAAAMEEEYKEHPDTFNPKMINDVKIALMGPLAGIGDSFFQGTIRTIAMSIGVSFAQQGSVLGPIIAMVISLGTSIPITWYAGKLGYLKGKELLQQIMKSDLMERIMYGCWWYGGLSSQCNNANCYGRNIPITECFRYGFAQNDSSTINRINVCCCEKKGKCLINHVSLLCNWCDSKLLWNISCIKI